MRLCPIHWVDDPRVNRFAGRFFVREGKSFERLVELMATLRAPGGCPWDREQTPESIRSYCLEEAYEVVEALDEGDPKKLCEELGDLLLQVVFHARFGE